MQAGRSLPAPNLDVLLLGQRSRNRLTPLHSEFQWCACPSRSLKQPASGPAPSAGNAVLSAHALLPRVGFRVVSMKTFPDTLCKLYPFPILPLLYLCPSHLALLNMLWDLLTAFTYCPSLPTTISAPLSTDSIGLFCPSHRFQCQSRAWHLAGVQQITC